MMWLIWSNEHNSWWRAGGAGYTKIKSEAGRYDFDKAIKEVQDANEGLRAEAPEETMCPDWEVPS